MFDFFKNIRIYSMRHKSFKYIVLGVILVLIVGIFGITTFIKGTANSVAYSRGGTIYKPLYDRYNGYHPAFFVNSKLDSYSAYCLDYGRAEPHGTLSFVRYLNNKTTSAMLYGYPYVSAASLGVANNNEAYAATQLAVWDMASTYGDNLTQHMPFKYSNLRVGNSDQATFDRIYNAAQSIRNKAVNSPISINPVMGIDSSSAKVVGQNGTIVAGPYYVEVSDCQISSITTSLSNAPASAYTCDAAGNRKTSFSNKEAIYVRLSGNEASSTLTLNVTVSAKKYVGAMYTNNEKGTQNYGTILLDPVTLKANVGISYQTLTGDIEILKVDQYDNPIQNVRFALYNSAGTKIAEDVTNSSGVVRFSGIKAGTYKIQEVSTPNGYVLGNEPISFTVTAGQVFTKKLVNRKIEGGLVVTKLNEYNEPIAGVTFQILDANKNVISTLKTDGNGIITVKNLPLGTYYYKEISGPANVVIDSTEYLFKIESDNQQVAKTVVNKLTRGKLIVHKVNDKNEPIPNVTFQILNSDKKVVETITTNAMGVAQTGELTRGTYYYKEVKAPENVIMDTNEYEFKMDGLNIEKTVTNNLVRGTLKIVKTNEYKEPIEGCKFEILNSDQKVITTITTDKNGEATVTGLEMGEYYYREVEAPSTVVMDKNTYKFEIEENNEVIAKTVINVLVRGKLQIVKKDEYQKPLEGVKFQILDSNKKVVETLTTDEEGKAESKELARGTYYYKEISAGDQYIVDTNEYEFNMNGVNIVKEIENKVKKGKLRIIKIDENEQPLAGVKYEIYDVNKKLVTTMTTNEEGIAESGDIVKGTYYYKEVDAPDNILMDPDMHKFEVEENNQVVIKKHTNNIIKGSLKIVKNDEYQKPLEGVKFQILNSDGKVVETITTDANGVAVSKKLEKGKYTFKEVDAPNGVIMNTEVFEFEVKENNELIVKNLTNDLIHGKLKIIKTDSDNKSIEGVKFNILNESKEVVDTIITDEKGEATSKDLVYGKYYYKEIEAPEYVVVDDKEYSFKIEEDNEVITKEVQNQIIIGKLKIIKLDKDSKQPMANVKFNLYKEGVEEPIQTLVTGSDGTIESQELYHGKYYFKEAETPENYYENSETYNFEINKNGVVVQQTVYNEHIKLPVTGSAIGTDGIIILSVAGVSIVLYIIIKIILYYKNYNKQI